MEVKEMKLGDFVDVHFPDGCLIGELISDEDETVTVKFDNGICYGIPKSNVTLWVAKQESQ